MKFDNADVEEFFGTVFTFDERVVYGFTGRFFGGDGVVGIPACGTAVENGVFVAFVVLLLYACRPVVVGFDGDQTFAFAGTFGSRVAAFRNGFFGRVGSGGGSGFIRIGAAFGTAGQNGGRQHDRTEQSGEESLGIHEIPPEWKCKES